MIFSATKSGRCANGYERDHGRVIHLVDQPNREDYSMRPALCGTTPGRRSAGWSTREQPATCPKCLKRAQALAAAAPKP